MKNILILMTIGAWLLLSCDKDDKSPTEKAWNLFEKQDYPAAHAAFSELADSDRPEVLTGLGWICLRMDSIPEAGNYFHQIAADTLIDAYAGWTAVLWQQKNYTACIEKGTTVLRKKPGYKFAYDKTVTIHDIIIHLGFSYYRMRDLTKCIEMIQKLDSSFTVPPLDDPKIDEKLIQKLEQLTELYR